MGGPASTTAPTRERFPPFVCCRWDTAADALCTVLSHAAAAGEHIQSETKAACASVDQTFRHIILQSAASAQPGVSPGMIPASQTSRARSPSPRMATATSTEPRPAVRCLDRLPGSSVVQPALSNPTLTAGSHIRACDTVRAAVVSSTCAGPASSVVSLAQCPCVCHGMTAADATRTTRLDCVMQIKSVPLRFRTL